MFFVAGFYPVVRLKLIVFSTRPLKSSRRGTSTADLTSVWIRDFKSSLPIVMVGEYVLTEVLRTWSSQLSACSMSWAISSSFVAHELGSAGLAAVLARRLVVASQLMIVRMDGLSTHNALTGLLDPEVSPVGRNVVIWIRWLELSIFH